MAISNEIINRVAEEKQRRAPKRGDIYRSVEGALLFIDEIAIHTQTGAPLVIYHENNDTIAAMPLELFLDKINPVLHAESKKKFQYERVIPAGELESEEFKEKLAQTMTIMYDMDEDFIRRFVIDRYFH